jgi:hypothetical protein
MTTIGYESMDSQNKSMVLQISYTIQTSLIFSQYFRYCKIVLENYKFI